MIVRAWFCRNYEPERPWMYTDGERVWAAADVRLNNTRMHYNSSAFMALPGGPKGIIEGTLVAAVDEIDVT